MSRYSFCGKFKVQPGKREEMIGILTEAAEGMSAVNGCHLYIVHRDMKDEDTTWVYELWDSKEDHDNSLKLESSAALIARAMPLMDGRPEVYELEVAGGKA